VLVIVFAVKYRDDPGTKVGAPITGSIPLELGWSMLPFIISMGIFVWATVVFFHMSGRRTQTLGDLFHRQALDVALPAPRRPERDQRAARAEGAARQGHVHVGRRAALALLSRRSASRPTRFPGRYSSVWFTPTQTGEFHLFCAEYCGTRHSGMIGTVIVMEPEGLPGLAQWKHRSTAGCARRTAVSAAGMPLLSRQ
jgi:cytochrome c oxidase subunit 2